MDTDRLKRFCEMFGYSQKTDVLIVNDCNDSVSSKSMTA